MIKLGCHLSISKGYYSAAKTAYEIGGNTFQFFTRNPRGGKAKSLDEEDIKKAVLYMNEKEFAPIVAHAAYTMNLCSKSKKTREFAKMIFEDDLNRLEKLDNVYYVFHPGSHTGQGVETGIVQISEALNEINDGKYKTKILLEGMSGKGTEIGSDFKEIAKIIKKLDYTENIGVCIDTCHMYSAGYDIVNDLEGVLKYIDKQVGLERLFAVHINDSKVEFASNKDRHEVLGKGTIGIDAILNLINHEKIKNLVFNLETPNEIEGYEKEIKLLKDKTE